MASGVARIVAMALLLWLAGCGSQERKASKAVTRYDQLYAERQYYAARIEISKAIAAQDDVPEYWAKLARVQLALGRFLDAYESYNRVIELEPDNREALEAMAELSYSGGQLEDSEKFADQILEKQPRSLRMLLVKGSIAATRNEPEKARAVADQMLEIDPSNEGGAILLARSQLIGGDREAAIATMEQSIAKDGESVAKLDVLLDLYIGRNDFRSVARTFARLFTLEPGNVDRRLDYVRILYEQGLPDRALAMLSRLARARPGDQELEQRIVDIWNEMGSDRVDVDRVRRFVGASGDKPMKVALAHLLLDQNRHADAEAVLRPFVDRGEITAANVEADVLYAGALSGLGRVAEARALIDRILDFDDNNPRALLMRVRISIARGDLPQALRDAQLLTRDNPDIVEGRLELARIYILRKEPILADKIYALAMSELSQDSEMLVAFIDYQLGRGRPAMAQDAARRFTRENPRSRDGWRERALLCIEAGDAPCVAQSFSALDMIPGGPRIRRALERQVAMRGGTARVEKAAAGQERRLCGRTGAPC